jgi:hypothetical protein
VRPKEPESRLTDDVAKRRAIVESGRYWVWSLSWEDLADDAASAHMEHLQGHVVQRILPSKAAELGAGGTAVPELAGVTGNAWDQLRAFIRAPVAAAWGELGRHAAGFSLVLLAGGGIGTEPASLSDDLFAEMAWPGLARPVVILAGDQAAFAQHWQEAGWTTVTEAEINAKGRQWLVNLIEQAAG